jgi:hypothetical protein
VSGLLDLIATEGPNPALLQVNTGAAEAAVGDTPYVLMRMEVDSVVVADSTGAESVGLSTLLDAQPDPFYALESCWLQHLEFAHSEVVDRLANRLPSPLRRGRASARWGWTATECNCGWRTTTATTTCDCRSRSRSTTSVA